MDRRIPALDGLRGLAIGIVLLRHLFGVRGAWAGVDLFFVLSGYLITTILRSERSEPHFWRIFYARRVTRIVPAFLILIAATLLLFRLPWHLLWPYYTFFAAGLANITFTDEMMGPLTVVWSLTVEEHFYFVWPATVRYLSDRALACILAVVVVAEPVARVLTLHMHPDWHMYYFLTPFRLDGLALGALLSLALSSSAVRSMAERSMGAMFYVALAVSCVVFGPLHLTREGNPWMYNAVGYSLIALMSVLLLGWLLMKPNGWAAKVLSLRPIVFLGRISYGLYLYHTLVRELVQRVLRPHGFTHPYHNNLVTLPLAIVLAWLSFRFLESPILGYGKRIVEAYRVDRSSADAQLQVRTVA